MENNEEITNFKLEEITELEVKAMTGFKLFVEIPQNLRGTMAVKKGGKTHTGGLVKITTDRPLD